MSDYSKTDIGSGYNTQTAVNTELGKIETAVNSKVDKSGSTMTGDLDMNSNDILNANSVDVQQLSIAGTNVTASGAAVSTLPTQAGNSAKVLSTNGSTAEWVQGSDKTFDTAANAKADTSLKIGEYVKIIERANSLWKVIAATGTENEYDTLAGTGAGVTLEWVDDGGEIPAKAFGVKADNSTDDYGAFQRAVTYAGIALNGGQGRTVRLPTGVVLISQRITQGNRVSIRGANGRGTTVRPFAGFSDNEMFVSQNGTSSIFGVTLEDMYIDARGFNMTQVVRSVAMQETCGLKRVVIQFDGTTNYGFYYEQGYGGAAYLPLEDVEIFSDSTSASAAGILVAQISLVGGFVLSVDGITVAGTTTNPIPSAIRMTNDSLIVRGLHTEYCTSGVVLNGAGSASIDTYTGSANQVTDLVTLGSGFTGRLNLQNIIPNGATGQTLKNNITGVNIAASDGMIPSYIFELSGFSAYHSADQTNVTGNGATATAIFDTEVFDRRSEYNNATGVFTAKRTGKYILSAYLKFNPTLSVTTCFIRITTSNRQYYLYRGDTDNIRDGSGNVTIGGTVIADMDVNDTARVELVCSGLAGDTIDILANESFFMGHWLER